MSRRALLRSGRPVQNQVVLERLSDKGSEVAQQTRLEELIKRARFDEARELVQAQLASGELLDPRTDRYWAPIADEIARAIQDPGEVVRFWEGLRYFFLTTIEPVWGHAHKGHIFFRLGLAVLSRDIARAKRELEAAYREDQQLARAVGTTPARISQLSRGSAYVALAILERIEDAEFANQADKESFVVQLSLSFDAAIMGRTVEPQAMHQTLSAIASAGGLEACQDLYAELDTVAGHPVATVSLTGALLEALLLAELYHRRGIPTITVGRRQGEDILRVELGPLLEEAVHQGVFPADSIRVACQLVQIFRNRLHPGNEHRQTYKLIPRVAMTVRVFFELALLAWRASLPPGN